jgi:hypothetical protein
MESVATICNWGGGKSVEVADFKGEKLVIPLPPGVLQKEAGFA